MGEHQRIDILSVPPDQHKLSTAFLTLWRHETTCQNGIGIDNALHGSLLYR